MTQTMQIMPHLHNPWQIKFNCILVMIPILSTSIHGSMFIITINTSALVHIQGYTLHPHFLGWHMELADVMSGYFILVYKHPSIQQNNQTIVIIVTNQGSYELIMVTKILSYCVRLSQPSRKHLLVISISFSFLGRND